MHIRHLTPMLLVLALAAAPTAAYAQISAPPPTGPTADPAETAKIRFGPLFMQPNFGLRDVGRDNNVFNDPENPASDWTATANMGMLAGLRFGPARLTVKTDSSYVYYAHFRSERAIDGNTRVQFEIRNPRLRPWIAMERIKSHDRSGLEIDERAGRETPAYEAGIEFRPGFRLGTRLQVKSREVEYEEQETFEETGTALGNALDASYLDVSLQLLYELSPLSNFRVSGELSRSRFEVATVRDADDVAVFVGIEGKREAALEGYVDAGWRERKALAPGAPSFSGFVARASAAVVLWDWVRVAFGADRDVAWSGDEAYTFYVQQGGSTTLAWRPHERVEVVTTGRYYDLAYEQPLDSTAAPRTDRVYSYGGGVGFFIRGYPGTRLGLNVERAVRESVLPGRRYDSPRFYTNVGFSF